MNNYYSFQTIQLDAYGGEILYDNGKEPTGTVYDDRLRQWDYEKDKALTLKHFGSTGQMWHGRSAYKIQDYLCDYFDKKVILCKVIKYKTPSGYDSFRFDYKEVNPTV